MKRTNSLFAAVAAAMLLFSGSGCEKANPQVKKTTLNLSGPKGMTVSWRGRVFDKLSLKMNPGEYVFKFTAPGCYPVWKKYVVTPGMSDIADTPKFTAYRSAVCLISSVRGGNGSDAHARVTFEGRPAGVTPLLLTDLAPGRYSAKLSLPGYADTSVEWEIADARPPAKINTELVSVLGRLIVTSSPRKAMVSINGRPYGPAPHSQEIAEGKIRIDAELPGYLPYSQTVSLARGEEKQVKLELVPSPSSLLVTSRPAPAEVFVNGEKRGTTPCKIENLAPANYQIQVVRANCDPWSRVMEIKPGSSEELFAELTASNGSVRFIVRPAGIDVSLDGRPLGKSVADPKRPGDTLPIVVSNLAPGKHLCVVSHPRAVPVRHEIGFLVTKGKMTDCKPVDVWVANCILEYPDGEPQRGALLYENAEFLMFSPQPGIQVKIPRAELKNIRKIDIDER